MGRTGRILGGIAVVVAALVGGQHLLNEAGAQDGLPDIGGEWTGLQKGKETVIDAVEKPTSIKTPFTFSVAKCGANIDGVHTPLGGESWGYSGAVGNGHFWAFHSSAGEPALITGHVSKDGSKWKGTLLLGYGHSVSDMKLSAVKAAE